MSHVLTRQELYDLAWSEPMQQLAKRFSLSDRGLAKHCAAANIPVPSRGYWAKLAAGKKVQRWALPARALGQSDEVHIGVDRWQSQAESDAAIRDAPIPPPPAFAPDMDTVRAQAEAMVRRAPVPLRDTHGWHSQIARFLAADEERRKKQAASRYPVSWDAPLFEGPFEQRRLRILNALFICLTRCGMAPHASGKYARELSVAVGNTGVPLTLDAVGAEKLIERERHGYGFVARKDADRLRLSIGTRYSSAEAAARSWEDQKGQRLERQLREIAAAIIVHGEQSYRNHASGAHAWRIKRKEQLFKEERQREIEAERKRRERLARLEKARVDHLLAQAHALHQAEQIRAFVAAVRGKNAGAAQPMAPEELEHWSGWALAQADRIDPVLSGAYKMRPAERPAATGEEEA